jgi:hypothetical protein
VNIGWQIGIVLPMPTGRSCFWRRLGMPSRLGFNRLLATGVLGAVPAASLIIDRID